MSTWVYLVQAAGRERSHPLMPPPWDFASPKGELCVCGLGPRVMAAAAEGRERTLFFSLAVSVPPSGS